LFHTKDWELSLASPQQKGIYRQAILDAPYQYLMEREEHRKVPKYLYV